MLIVVQSARLLERSLIRTSHNEIAQWMRIRVETCRERAWTVLVSSLALRATILLRANL